MIDESVLERLGEDLGGREGLREILDAYLSDATRLMGELEKAGHATDGKALVMAAHTLKSSSALLGALALSEICREAETRGRDGDVEGARGLLPRLVEELRASTGELARYRARLG